MCDADKCAIISDIFGKDGIAESDDALLFDCRLQTVLGTIDTLAPAFTKYFIDTIVPLLQNIIIVSQKVGLQLPPRSWTNNNSESVNHALKQAIDWKPKPLTGLIDSMHGVVRGQYREIEGSLVGLGYLQLCPEYQRFYVPAATWAQLPADKRTRHLKNY